MYDKYDIDNNKTIGWYNQTTADTYRNSFKINIYKQTCTPYACAYNTIKYIAYMMWCGDSKQRECDRKEHVQM